MQTSDYRKQVTERLIGMLESGTAPWQKPWDAGIAAMNRPHNFNGRPYHGVNALMLWCTAIDKGYEDPRWLTFNQIKKLGGHVNKGEKAQVVEYWQWTKDVENPETGEKETVELDHPRVYRAAVFNADQCSGLPPLERPVQQWTPHERADRIVAANGVQVTHNSDQGAFYSPGGDYICLPPKESFATEDAYYSTLLHEVGHSTGHPTRLNRDFGGSFGTESYAKEELRAELASTFLCGELGIATSGSDEQHAAYVKSWVRALKDDYNEIFRAAADAEKICNYLYEREAEYLKEQEQGLIHEAQAQPEAVVDGVDETVLRRMTPENYVDGKVVEKMPDAINDDFERAYKLRMADVAIEKKVRDEEGNLTPLKTDFVGKSYIHGEAVVWAGDPEIRGLYMGDAKHIIDEHTYDTSKGSLRLISHNEHLIALLVPNNFECTLQDAIREGRFTHEDFQEFNKIYDDFLKKFKKDSEITFAGEVYTPELYKKVFENSINQQNVIVKEADKMAEEKSAMESFEGKPATDAQKAYAMALGIRFKDEITKDDLAKRISKRLEINKKLAESLSKPATQEQLDTLKENNIEIKDGMTIGDASKLISKLPVTPEQLVYMDRIKLDYDKDITRGEAEKLITSRMNYLEKAYALPATEKQVALLDKRGIEHSENVTVGEFKEKMYFAKPTEKQLKYLDFHKIEYDKEKICYGKADTLIDTNKKYIEMRKNLPATDKQINFLKENNIEYPENITAGQASKMIDEHLTASQNSNELTAKQKAFLEKRGLPTDIDKKEANQIIGRTVNLEKIQNYTAPDGKANIYDEYRGLAKKQMESGKEIDDKKIAAELLKSGHTEKMVQKAIFTCSPANDYNHSLKMVKAAAKMPTVAKKMKENEANRGR